jgi:hypothetical protein
MGYTSHLRGFVVVWKLAHKRRGQAFNLQGVAMHALTKKSKRVLFLMAACSRSVLYRNHRVCTGYLRVSRRRSLQSVPAGALVLDLTSTVCHCSRLYPIKSISSRSRQRKIYSYWFRSCSQPKAIRHPGGIAVLSATKGLDSIHTRL